jgi:hypothetical protein
LLARRTNIGPIPELRTAPVSPPSPVVRTIKPKRPLSKWRRMTKSEREALVREVWDTAPSIRVVASSLGTFGCVFSKIAQQLGLQPRRRTNNTLAERAARDRDCGASL